MEIKIFTEYLYLITFRYMDIDKNINDTIDTCQIYDKRVCVGNIIKRLKDSLKIKEDSKIQIVLIKFEIIENKYEE